jgi:hypothetical protein
MRDALEPERFLMTGNVLDSQFHDDEKFDVHWAASRNHCLQIGKRISKRLLDVKGPTEKGLLPYQCIFEGPQTSFAEGDKDDG